MKYTEKEFKQWKSYEKVRRSGDYNMVVDFDRASKKAGLSITIYTKIMRKYADIERAIIDKYGSIENYMEK